MTTMQPGRTHIMLEVAEGRGAGAVLENGFLERCLEADLGVHVISPGARYEPFVQRYSHDGVRFSYLPVDRYTVGGRWPNGVSWRAVGPLVTPHGPDSGRCRLR